MQSVQDFVSLFLCLLLQLKSQSAKGDKGRILLSRFYGELAISHTF